MNEDDALSFLSQFSDAKKRVSNWPEWMQESAKVATASLPHVSDSNQKVTQPLAPLSLAKGSTQARASKTGK